MFDRQEFLDSCAKQAMSSILIRPDAEFFSLVNDKDKEAIAKLSYDMAEAMLKERMKRIV